MRATTSESVHNDMIAPNDMRGPFAATGSRGSLPDRRRQPGRRTDRK